MHHKVLANIILLNTLILLVENREYARGVVSCMPTITIILLLITGGKELGYPAGLLCFLVQLLDFCVLGLLILLPRLVTNN